ncbi:MAG: hypothetical protein WCO11_03490 [Sphingomonadales bacterium]|jgi:hypothetical protein
MSTLKSKKLSLLQGVSTIMLLGMANSAYAQQVTTTATGVQLDPTVQARVVVNQDSGAGAIATVGTASDTAGGGVAVSNTSVTIANSATTATAINNSAASSLADSAAAATATTSGIAVKQSTGQDTSAQTTSTRVTLTTGVTQRSPLTISGAVNRVAATANGATSAVSDTDFATNSTMATLAAQQQNSGTPLVVGATSLDTQINLTAGATTGSGLSVNGSADAAIATANSLTQSMNLTGTTLTLGTGSATAQILPTADVSATGAALLSSSQANTATIVQANTAGSAVTLVAGATNSASLDVTNNMQAATAAGSTAGNSVALSGTTVGTGVAIVSAQAGDAGSTVSAFTSGQAGITAASLGATAGSSASLTDNMLQSRATGGTVTNTLAATATTISVSAPASGSAASINSGGASPAGNVNGAYATLNGQLISSTVTATTDATAGFSVGVTGQVSNGSSINNDRNAVTAQAQGAVAANTTTLAVGGTLSNGGGQGLSAPAAVIANTQLVSGSADVVASVTRTAPASAATTIGGALADSSVSTSNNRAQALADGASATNALTGSATTLTTAAGNIGGQADRLQADAAFAVVNRQDSRSSKITAQLNDPITVRTAITGNSSNSSVASTGNMQDAFATSNKAANSLALSATTLTSSGAVVNNQNSGASVASLIGATQTLPGGTTPGAVGADAGITVNFSGNISSDAVAVTGNIVRGSAISNVGTNTLTASATTVTGDVTAARTAALSPTQANFGLNNSQTLDPTASSTTNVYATYGAGVAGSVTGSQVSVSNNTQFGEALGNSATNRAQLTFVGAGASGIDPTAALENNQSGVGAHVNATSDMALRATMASSGSTIALNGNNNTALGVINNASNTVSVSGLAVNGVGSMNRASVDGMMGTSADYALDNNQNATGTLNSTAKTVAGNLDNVASNATTPNLLNGTSTLSKNTTTAEASANRVANSLAVSATNNGATAALGNRQFSDTVVTAEASNSVYKLDLTAATPATTAASASSVAVEGNTTTALARGNSASNALNYTVNVAFNGFTAPSTTMGTNGASAGAVVLNSQENMSSVTAKALNVAYTAGLSGSGAQPAGSVLNSSASLSNNTASAVAFGNAATNTLTMATWSAGIPSSVISSNQVNGGAVVAQASNAFAMNPVGAASGSMIRNSGNTTAAQAIGNNSVNSIGGGGM